MNVVLIISLVSTFLFGCIALFFSVKEEKLKKQLAEQDSKQKHRLYEISILKDIEDKISYSLDIEKVFDVITASLRNLFPYSTASSLLLKENSLIFKTYVEERVSHRFVAEVRERMLASLTALLNKPAPIHIEETTSGLGMDDTNPSSVASFFHIPLIVNDNIVGLINVSSTKPNLYAEDEMTVLYQITHQASVALSRLHEVLANEKGKLLSLIKSLADGVFMVDVNNRLTLINGTAKELLGIQKEHPNLVDVLSSMPKSLDLGIKIEKVITQNVAIEEKEVNLGTKTLQVFITPVVNVKKTQFTEDSQKPDVLGASVLLHDITLEKNLAGIKEDFTNMIVHELRSPLTAMQGASQLLVQEKALKDAEREKLLHIVNEQSAKLLDEVSSLLDAAKLDAGKFVVEKTSTDLSKVLKEKVDLFTQQASAKGITLASHIDPTLPLIEADEKRIGQVINNLLSNSLKFTQSGGAITLAAHLDGSQVTVSVADSGIGISKDKQPQLFTRFAQLSHPTGVRPTGSGTGLGLFIVKGIVEAHGGTVELDSEAGKGTTISFTIPVGNPQAALATNGAPSAHLFNTSVN